MCRCQEKANKIKIILSFTQSRHDIKPGTTKDWCQVNTSAVLSFNYFYPFFSQRVTLWHYSTFNSLKEICILMICPVGLSSSFFCEKSVIMYKCTPTPYVIMTQFWLWRKRPLIIVHVGHPPAHPPPPPWLLQGW